MSAVEVKKNAAWNQLDSTPGTLSAPISVPPTRIALLTPRERMGQNWCSRDYSADVPFSLPLLHPHPWDAVSRLINETFVRL